MSWKVTNIGGIGSSEDLEQRVAAAQTEAEWKDAGKKAGLQIWRVENFGVKSWPPDRYGEFFQGDSYICLHTYEQGGAGGRLAWDVFFWLGKETTIDEQGTAALKTIELDDLLGTLPVQFRETQGHESEKFLDLFGKSGIRILEGGIKSGFRHVEEEEFKPRLMQVKGKKYVRCIQVPLSCESLNTGDAFILDAGEKCYMWVPSKASHTERFKAAQVISAIRSSRRGKVEEVRLEEVGSEVFWNFFGGKGEIKGHDEVESDEEFDEGAKGKFPKIMYQLSDESGAMEFKKVEEVGRKNYLSKKKLDHDDVFVIDLGNDVIAWIGKGASPDERKKAILYASNYIGLAKKPSWTRITRVEDGKEGKKFFENFI